VPSHLPDGSPNRIWARRLKDKLGTRGLATAETELDDAWAVQVAAPPDGLKAMMEALEYSRIHNAVAAAGVERRALVEALCWTDNRRSFGAPLRDRPMIRDTLLDLAMEQQADTALAFEAALAFDAALVTEAGGASEAGGMGQEQRSWLRTVTALAKYRTAAQTVRAATAAVEMIGGNGYTEDWPTARLYRDALVLPVWEGPANIQALELLRTIAGRLQGDRRFLERIDGILDAAPARLQAEASLLRVLRAECAGAFRHLRTDPAAGPRHARHLMGLMADMLAACLLIEEAAQDKVGADGHKTMLAARFVATHFGGRTALVPETDMTRSCFDAILAPGPASRLAGSSV
jgi:hypothetical protein